MVEIKEIDILKNEVTYEDFSKISFSEFQDTFTAYWNKRIAGETISPFDMERFMKRSSSKNLKQLIDGKKAEGILEATIGKKLNPNLVKFIVIMLFIAMGVAGLVIILKMMGLL